MVEAVAIIVLAALLVAERVDAWGARRRADAAVAREADLRRRLAAVQGDVAALRVHLANHTGQLVAYGIRVGPEIASTLQRLDDELRPEE